MHEYIGVPEQALGWLPLGLGLVVEDEPHVQCTIVDKNINANPLMVVYTEGLVQSCVSNQLERPLECELSHGELL